MQEEEEEKKETSEEFHVVVNHEEQYSIWPVGREVPHGWQVVGPARTEADCLAYIEQTWTDMRPLSLRQFLANQGE